MIHTSTVHKIKQRDDIQIYRGICVLSVILYHLSPEIFKFGYLGVDVFFIISGFVISNLIFSKLSDNSFSLKKFYLQRFRRIFPSLISFILVVQILIYFFLDHEFISQATKGNLYSLFFLSNVYFSQIIDYFSSSAGKNLIINLWSLSVEEQFYIVFPLLAILLRKVINLKKIYLILIFSLISLSFYHQEIYGGISFLKRIFFTYENFIFYSPFTRALEFLLGVLAMFLNQSIRKRIYTIKKINKFNIFQLTILTFMVFGFNVHFDILNKIFITLIFFYLLVNEIQIYKKNNFIYRFILFTGNISYSLYLFHQPIFASLRNYNFYADNPIHINLYIYNLANIFFVICVIYIVSYLNFVIIENKYRHLTIFKVKDFRSFIFVAFASISLIVLSINSNGYDFRDSEIKSFNKDSNITFVPGTNYITQNTILCIGRESIKDSCRFNSGSNDIYIIGDSVMSSIVSGYVENKNLKNYNLIEFTTGGCPLLLNHCGFIEGSNKYSEIVNIKNSIIILGGIYTPYINESNFEENFLKTINILSETNKLFVYGTFPGPGINVRMYKQINKKFPTTDQQFLDNNASEIESILLKENLNNVQLVNPRLIFCSKKSCNYFSNKEYYFNDHVHFSYYGAKKIAEHFVKTFENDL